MTSFISDTTVDCANAYELSEWWKPVLGYVDIDGDPNLPGHEELERLLAHGAVEIADHRAGSRDSPAAASAEILVRCVWSWGS